jgi:hypothetical protein
MKMRYMLQSAVIACGLLGCAASGNSNAADNSAAATVATTASAERDGSHDFDFDFGVWTTHITRRVHPLTGSDESMQLTGTVTVRKVWQGKAALEEIEADGPKGHWEGMSVFLYDPHAHQWSQTFVGSARGTFTGGLIGSFHDGRGELYSTDTVDGRAILVRGTWSDIKPTSHRYQEAYSTDGGKTWEIQFTADLTKAAS